MRLALLFVHAAALALPTQATHPNSNQLLAEAAAAQQSNDLKTAEGDYRELVALHPKSADIHAELGGVLALEEKYEPAVAEFTAALAGTSRKHQPELLYAIGKAYVAEEHYDQARSALESALHIQPKSALVAVLLGECDLKLHQPQAAVDLLAPMATLSTHETQFLYVYSKALIQTGKLGEGATMLEQVAQSTDDADSFQLAGMTFLKNGDLPSARRDLEQARKIDPSLERIDLQLASVREQSGDTYAAEAIFREELKMKPDDFTANLWLGALLYKHRKAAEAGPYLDHALALQPENAIAQCESKALQSNTTCATPPSL